MAYYPDLSPYEYSSTDEPRKNVGWLDKQHTFDRRPFPSAWGVAMKLELLARNPKNLTRGSHLCDLCTPPPEVRDHESYLEAWSFFRQGNGEIHLDGPSGLYAAPALIWHYISEHQYHPPDEFIELVRAIWVKDIL